MITKMSDLEKYAKDYKRVPVAKAILSDAATPIEVMRRLKKVSRHCFILESVESQKYWGRYTFLGYDPALEISCSDYKMNIKSVRDSLNDEIVLGKGEKYEKPEDYLRYLIEENRSPRIEGLPTFTGGLVGYFAYDYIKYAEPRLKLDAKDEDGFKDMDLMLFDKVIAFDNIMQKMILIVNISTDDLAKNYEQAIKTLNEMEEIVTAGQKEDIPKGRLLSDFRGLFSKEEYEEMVEKGKYYIHEGDIFQVVLSNRFEADFTGSLFDTYRVLRATNPSPYMFYFGSDDMELAGASPETLVKVDDGDTYTFPLAGTRPRGKDDAEDKALEEELLQDEKELAEHNMLVDLGRNDIGRVAEFGSVKVERYMDVQRYSHVMHIGSTVHGKLRADKDALSALSAILPAGTLSGAPKIRACEIINELEDSKRGVYGGAVGYIDFTGNLDICIAIRLAFKKGYQVFVRAGAGIVADSVPATEYQESINKSKAVMNALREANEM